jgi:hypothetical protein
MCAQILIPEVRPMKVGILTRRCLERREAVMTKALKLARRGQGKLLFRRGFIIMYLKKQSGHPKPLLKKESQPDHA